MMLQIFSLLLDVVLGGLAATCLLRMYMQLQRVSLAPLAGNPLAPFIFSLTDWCVLPLRKLLPVLGRIDSASLLSAYLLLLVKLALLSLLSGFSAQAAFVLFFALLELAHLALSGLIWLTMIYVILSWIRTQADLHYFLARLVEPLLRPFQQVLPRPGGLDFSPLALLLTLKILEIILNRF